MIPHFFAILSIFVFSAHVSADFEQYSFEMPAYSAFHSPPILIHSSDDTMSHPPGNGHSYAKLTGSVTTQDGNAHSGTFEVFIANPFSFQIGGTDPDGHQYVCCSQQFVDAKIEECPPERLHKALVSKPARAIYSAEFSKSTSAHLVSEWIFADGESSHPSSLYVVNCNPDLDTTLDVKLTIEWMNPYGYLPGSFYSHWLSFKYFGIINMACLFVWALACLKSRATLGPMHILFSILLIINLAKMILNYSELSIYNDSGQRNTALFNIASFFTAIFDSCFRTIMMIVSTGFGSINPVLHNIKVLATYLFFDTLFNLIHLLHHNGEDSNFLFLRLIVLGVFVVLTNTFLHRTYASIRAKTNKRKKDFFRALRYAFMVYSLLTCLVYLADRANWTKEIETPADIHYAIIEQCLILWMCFHFRPSVTKSGARYTLLDFSSDQDSSDSEDSSHADSDSSSDDGELEEFELKGIEPKFSLGGDAEDSDDSESFTELLGKNL